MKILLRVYALLTAYSYAVMQSIMTNRLNDINNMLNVII